MNEFNLKKRNIRRKAYFDKNNLITKNGSDLINDKSIPSIDVPVIRPNALNTFFFIDILFYYTQQIFPAILQVILLL